MLDTVIKYFSSSIFNEGFIEEVCIAIDISNSKVVCGFLLVCEIKTLVLLLITDKNSSFLDGVDD